MVMKKTLFYIVTGEMDKARMGLMVARRAAEFKRFGDVKVILQELDILPVIKLEYHRTNISTLVAFVFPGYETHLKH